MHEDTVTILQISCTIPQIALLTSGMQAANCTTKPLDLTPRKRP